jgi:hypothetical protein
MSRFFGIVFMLAAFKVPMTSMAQEIQSDAELSAEEEHLLEEDAERVDTMISETGGPTPHSKVLEEDTFSGVIDYLEQEQYLIEKELERQRIERSKKFSDKVKDFHTHLSEDIVSIADSIDTFFVNKNILDSRNRSNIRLTNTANIVEKRDFDNDFDFKIRLRLPHLLKKIQLEFEDEALVDDTVGARDNLTQTPEARAQQQGGNRGALSFYQDLMGIETKLSTGVEFRSEIVLFGRFRITKNFVLTPRQKITFIHDVFDDTTDNKGQLGILNYDYSFNNKLMLRFLNEENYRDINNTFRTTHGLSLYHRLSDRNFLSYNYRAESINPEGQSTFFLNTHVLNVNFRRRLYREHLYYELGPGMIFPKTEGFEGLLAFMFRLELIFGNV